METSLSHAVAEGSGPHAIGCVFPPSKGRPTRGQWEPTRQHSRKMHVSPPRASASGASPVQARPASITKSGNLVPMQDRPTCGPIRMELDGLETGQGVQAAWQQPAKGKSDWCAPHSQLPTSGRRSQWQALGPTPKAVAGVRHAAIVLRHWAHAPPPMGNGGGNGTDKHRAQYT